MLLARPGYDPQKHTETVCDKDGFIANAWRAMQGNPDEVARYCDHPVNHADLSARKLKLIENSQYLLDHLIADPEWFDAKLAGYWIWAANCWIGSGLTSIGQIPHLAGKGRGVHAIGQRPHLADKGRGVHAIGQRPHLSGKGMGVHAIGQIPYLSNKGLGVHAIGKRPHLSNKGLGVHKVSLIGEPNISLDVREPYNTNIYKWFRQLSERLRYVRVVCGDWTRVCGGDWQDSNWEHVGIFFDPPYAVADRDAVYDTDSFDVAHAVRAWALKRGDRPSYRIIIAGYEEHEELTAAGWTVKRWKTGGGYGNLAGKKNSRGKDNRRRECLYLSPHCLKQGLDLGI